MAVNWSEAVEVERVAEWLIPQFHTHLEQNGVEIRYRHRDDKPRSGDREVLGGVSKIASLAAFEARGDESGDGAPFFVLWIPEHVWEMLPREGKVGLVDKLLCQMQSGKDDEGVVRISKRRPDFDGFFENVERCGFWEQEALRMFEAMRRVGQLTLELEECPLPRKPLAEVVATGSLEPADVGRRGVPPLPFEPDPGEGQRNSAVVRRSLREFQAGMSGEADEAESASATAGSL